MTEHIYESAIREQIAKHSTDGKKALQQFSGQLFDTISQGLLQNGHVRIHQFGSFKLNWAKERRTGASLLIPAQPRISFTPAKALKDQVNMKPEAVKPAISPLTSIIDDRSKTRKQSKPVLAGALQTGIIDTPALPEAKPSTGNIEQNIPGPAVKAERAFVLKRQTALAASIIVALIAAVLIWPGDKNDVRSVLEPAAIPDLIQPSSQSLFTNNQVAASAQTDDTEDRLLSDHTPSTDITTAADAPTEQHNNAQIPKSFFREQAHKLVAGDSLWRLSRKHYTNPFYWPHIYHANHSKIDNPNKLKLNSHIQLPAMHGIPENLTPEDRRSIAEGYFLVYQYLKRTNRPFPYYALLGVNKFDPAVIQKHISEIDEQDWQSFQLASN